MKLGPLTFQCACFICVARSTASASRACSRLTAALRVLSGISIFVLYMAVSALARNKDWLYFYHAPPPGSTRGIGGGGCAQKPPIYSSAAIIFWMCVMAVRFAGSGLPSVSISACCRNKFEEFRHGHAADAGSLSGGLCSA